MLIDAIQIKIIVWLLSIRTKIGIDFAKREKEI